MLEFLNVGQYSRIIILLFVFVYSLSIFKILPELLYTYAHWLSYDHSVTFTTFLCSHPPRLTPQVLLSLLV